MSWKIRAKSTLLRSRILSALRRAMPRSAAILRYHSINDDTSQLATTIGRGLMHSAEEFAAHMELVSREFVPITMDEILEHVEGNQPLPKGAVAITFDDGYRDNFEVAAPILHRYDLKASFYVSVAWIDSTSAPWFCRLRRAFFTSPITRWSGASTTHSLPLDGKENRLNAFRDACRQCAVLCGQAQEAFVCDVERQLGVSYPNGSRLMMSWDELRQLLDQGHIVGSHTLTHPNVAHIGEQEMFTELSLAKTTLEDRLGTEVHHFSYPSPCLDPHWSNSAIKIAQRVNYRTSVTCERGVVNRRSNLFCLPRLACRRDVESLQWDIEKSFLGFRP